MAEKITRDQESESDPCCTVCLEEYKNPKLLPCSHTYCASCLEAILKQTGSQNILTCPQCRAQHQVPTGGPQFFITDFTVTQDTETRKWHETVAKTQTICGVCEHTGVTVSYCPECEAFLCSYCAGAHKRMKVFSSHQVVSVDKYVSFKPKPKPIHCLLHPTCQVNFFCGTCSQLICNECVVGTEEGNSYDSYGSPIRSEGSLFSRSSDHSRHKLYTLTLESVKMIEAKLDKAIEHAESNEQTVQSELQQLQEIEKNHEKHTEDLKRALNDSIDSYIKALHVHHKKEISRINKESSSVQEAIQVHKKRLQSKLDNFHSSLRFAEKAKNCDETVHKIAMMGQAMAIPHLKTGFTWSGSMMGIGRTPVVTSGFSEGSTDKKLPSLSQLCGPPLVVSNLEAKLSMHGLIQQYTGTNMQVEVMSPGGTRVGLSRQCQLGQKCKVSLTFSVQPIGQPKFRIMYGGSNFQKELSSTCTTGSTTKSWVLTFSPCCNGTHMVHVQIYGRWITQDAPTFNVTGELEEGDIVRRTPTSKFTVADLFKDTEGEKNQSDYEIGKLTKVERSYIGKSYTSSYKVEVTWGHETKEPKVEELSFIWSEYSGFPLELAILRPSNPTLPPSKIPPTQLRTALFN